jgi:hypothetical protein
MRRHAWTRAAAATTALLALGLGAAGCRGAAPPSLASAGGGSSSASPDPSAPATDDTQRGRQFAACMREHGIDMPDPEPADPLGKRAVGGAIDQIVGADKQKLVAAMDACRHYLPKGGESGPLTPEQLERQRAFAACMRDNGVEDFPDPDPDGGAIRDFVLDKDAPGIRDALETCRDTQPEPSGSPGAGR